MESIAIVEFRKPQGSRDSTCNSEELLRLRDQCTTHQHVLGNARNFEHRGFLAFSRKGSSHFRDNEKRHRRESERANGEAERRAIVIGSEKGDDGAITLRNDDHRLR